VKLNLVWFIGRPNLTVPLLLSDGIDERRMPPGFQRSYGLRGADDVGSSLFDYRESVELQLTDDRCLACAGRTGDDEPSHAVSFRWPVALEENPVALEEAPAVLEEEVNFT
jgi:hypothetical protein